MVVMTGVPQPTAFDIMQGEEATGVAAWKGILDGVYCGEECQLWRVRHMTQQPYVSTATSWRCDEVADFHGSVVMETGKSS